jgi:copper resistance protein D
MVFAASLVSFGASVFFCYGLRSPAASPPRLSRRWPWIVLVLAAAIALMGSVIWLAAEAAALGGDTGSLNAAAIWAVVTDTHFGRIGGLRCLTWLLILIALAAVKIDRQRICAWHALPAALVVGSLAWTGHGNIDTGISGWVHLGSDVLHLLTAGLWVGALVPLCVLIVTAVKRRTVTSEYELAFGLDRFSLIGVPVVAVLLLSGIVNSWFLVGPTAWRSVLTTLYGELLLAKVVLFALMLMLAAVNRLRLAPQLKRGGSAVEAKSALWQNLRATLFAETALATLVLGLVAIIGTLEPPISAN